MVQYNNNNNYNNTCYKDEQYRITAAETTDWHK